MYKELTCIVCPMGCTLSIELDGKDIVSVTGNTCPRGKVYAENECTNPKRTVTSTMRCTDGTLVSVKTDDVIPKDKIFDCMKIINSSVAQIPVSIGDVLIENVFGANVVATQNKGV
ncbi:MAG: DUF1667 domain-containing protein [Ruminococcaceae bacterium]|nr:DUF1667 domain-containing protein [Oscillospiraceae bacterium]